MNYRINYTNTNDNKRIFLKMKKLFILIMASLLTILPLAKATVNTTYQATQICSGNEGELENYDITPHDSSMRS